MTNEEKIESLEKDVLFLKEKLAESVEQTIRLNKIVERIVDGMNDLSQLTNEGFQALGSELQKR